MYILHTSLIYLQYLLTKLQVFIINITVNAAVAQSVEQGTENPCVKSSSLFGGIRVKTVNVLTLFL